MATTVLIYRPLGEHPPRTKMGELDLGVVHSIAEGKAAPYLPKGFKVISSEDAAILRSGKPLPILAGPLRAGEKE